MRFQQVARGYICRLSKVHKKFPHLLGASMSPYKTRVTYDLVHTSVQAM